MNTSVQEAERAVAQFGRIRSIALETRPERFRQRNQLHPLSSINHNYD